MRAGHELLRGRAVDAGQMNLELHFKPVTDSDRADPNGRRHRGVVGDCDLSSAGDELHRSQKAGGIAGGKQLLGIRSRAARPDNAELTIELNRGIALEERSRFAIREGNRTVGAGIVTQIVE
jgi:hypothetical protein